MIVCNSRKFVYLRVPRTGSTSLSNFLIANLTFDPKTDIHTPIPYNKVAGLNCPDATRVHATLDEIIAYGYLQHPIGEYRVFGVIRDPVDRFLSSAWLACRQLGINVTDNNEAVRRALPVAGDNETVFRRQTDWLLHEGKPVDRIFPYRRLDELAQELLGLRQASVTFRHRSESRGDCTDRLDQGLRNEILARYGDDQKLYERVIGQGEGRNPQPCPAGGGAAPAST